MRNVRFGWTGLLLVTTALTAAGTLCAAEAGASQQMAQVQTNRFDIAPQPLGKALEEFGRQSGLQVSYPSHLAQGLSSPGVAGTLTADAALARLLVGTGMTWRFSGTSTVILEKTAAEGVMTLDPVTVEGAPPAMAAETARGPVKGVVAKVSATATKTDTPIVETPQSISVVTRDEMETRTAESVQQAVRYTPGVRSETAGAQTAWDQVSVRGFSQGTLQFYRDGTMLAPPGYFGFFAQEPYGLERVEVLRGPSSVMYGQNTPGGLINMASKLPTVEPRHEIELQGGSHNRKQTAYDTSGPLNADKTLLYRVIALGRESDTGVDHVESNRRYLSGSLTWRPDADTTLTLLTEYQRDDGDYIVPLPAAVTAKIDNNRVPRDLYPGDPNYNRLSNTVSSVGYMAEHHLNDTWTLRQNLRYSEMEGDRRALTGTSSSGAILARQALDRAVSAEGIVIDNQAQARFATGPLEHTLLGGVDYRWGSSRRDDRSGTAPSLNMYAPVYGVNVPDPKTQSGQEQTQRQLGVYVQEQMKIDGKWVVQFGGRHDRATSTTDSYLSAARSRVEQDDRAFTGRAGVVYLSETGLAPYVSYSQSFLPVSGTDINAKPFEPETAEQYEVGVRFQPPGGKSMISLAAFDLTRQNVTTPNPANTAFNVQQGEWTSRGVEVEGKVNLVDDLNLIGSYTYNPVSISKANTNAAGLNTTGNNPAGVPRRMASLWLDQKFSGGTLDGLGLGAGARYVGKSYGDDANTYTVRSFTLYDASISYDLAALNPDLQGTSLTVTGTNLFDKEYVSICTGSAVNCFYGEGRTVYATLRYRW